jgi:hypothetical protein
MIEIDMGANSIDVSDERTTNHSAPSSIRRKRMDTESFGPLGMGFSMAAGYVARAGCIPATSLLREGT